MTKEEKKDRNTKVVKIYVDNNHDIDATVKIIESIPELAKTFVNKDMRRSAMGIIQSAGKWKKLEKPAPKKKDEGPTKKELAGIFCNCFDLEVSDVPTLLNMRKVELAILIDAFQVVGLDTYQPTEKEIKEVNKILEKVE